LDAVQETSGILLIDKPVGITSAGVVNRIKRIAGIRKAGHTGTLDPFASGLMVCTVNQATRLSRFFLCSRKKYEGLLVLGVETDTQDATGRVLKTSRVDHIPEADIHGACKRFEGEIEQVPPAFSALKHQGVPLYKYARQGKPVIKPPRRVSVSYIRIDEINLPEIRFETECASGTYIRSLCADIGKALGCGGHLKRLNRIETAGFHLGEAMPLTEMDAFSSIDALGNRLIPMADALLSMAAHVAGSNVLEKIRYGKPLTTEDIPAGMAMGKGGYIKITDADNRLLAVVSPSGQEGRYNYCCVFYNS